MKTFRAILKNPTGGSDHIIGMVGKDEIDAIRDYFQRKKDIDGIYSIIEEKGLYTIEHSGREVKTYKEGQPYDATVYSDRVDQVIEMKNLLVK